MSRLYFWNLSKACWMVGFALAAGLKSRLRTRETPPFSRKIPLARSTLPENGTKRKSPKSFESTNNSRLSDAADGGRTRTLSPERDFKSLVSANFTTAAQTRLTKFCCPLAWEGTGNNRCEVKCHPNDLPSLEVT